MLILALINPAIQSEEREMLSNVVFLVVDQTESQKVSLRPAQVADAAEKLAKRIAELENFELVRVDVRNDADSGSSASMVLEALSSASADFAQNRIAGAIVVTDGQIHDAGRLKAFPGPVHVVLAGEESEWDRRLFVQNVPAFAIVGDEFPLRFRVESQGNVPSQLDTQATVSVSVDGAAPSSFSVAPDQEIEIPLTLEHGGLNSLQVRLIPLPGELTDRNNLAVARINGVRDGLKVALISGVPYAGERTWRNLLKSDSSVDLVHLTILRSSEKIDDTPVNELALIAFPARELFVEKLDQFDLVIFDRYENRGLLPAAYLERVKLYVRNGGAVLIAAGPSLASANSLYQTPLADILPARPTGRVIEYMFRPTVTDAGNRHPVTEDLGGKPSMAADATESRRWGRWHRLVDALPERGKTIMADPEGRPLLVLDQVGEGRVAMLLSDHAWLWARGYDGGGPQLELIRRLAHWMMKEPELEEERLFATTTGSQVQVHRRTMTDRTPMLAVTGPEGEAFELDMVKTAPGKWLAEFEARHSGSYGLHEGELSHFIVVGPPSPREFENALATREHLFPLTEETGGSIADYYEGGVPEVRSVRAGRIAKGRGWIGLEQRNAFLIVDSSRHPIAPAWAFMLVFVFLAFASWRLEGR